MMMITGDPAAVPSLYIIPRRYLRICASYGSARSMDHGHAARSMDRIFAQGSMIALRDPWILHIIYDTNHFTSSRLVIPRATLVQTYLDRLVIFTS